MHIRAPYSLLSPARGVVSRSGLNARLARAVTASSRNLTSSSSSSTPTTTTAAVDSLLSKRTWAQLSLSHPDAIVNRLETTLRFLPTRVANVIRETYYDRKRSNDRSSYGRSGGSGGIWASIRRFINGLPPNLIVYGIIAANGGVFLLWQYAFQTYVRVTLLVVGLNIMSKTSSLGLSSNNFEIRHS